MKKKFAPVLLRWNTESNHREMPWKGEKNPYLIWLSEIIMQQTRVEQGLPYFLQFKKKYPSVKHLAKAPADEVMRLWQGLGYYSRARNLHTTARYVATDLKGAFPKNFDELKKLKGVGEYTAAAIASFAYGEPKAVVEGNVIRVLARLYGVATPFDTAAGKKEFAQLAQQLIDEKNPAAYNQAIMDFGALVCTPKNPKCGDCPFQKSCVAFNQNLIGELPFREKKTKVTERYFNYLVIKTNDEIFITKRTGNDIWKNLFQLPMIETGKPVHKNLQQLVGEFFGGTNFTIINRSKYFVQLLTHRKINACFMEVEVENFKSLKLSGAQRVKVRDLFKFAFPKTVHLYLSQNSLL